MHAVLDQRLGHRPGAGTELDHRPVAIRIDISRHVAGEQLARGVTAPTASGFLIQEPMKRTSSSRRMPFFCSKRRMRLLDVAADLLAGAAERPLDLLLEMLFDQPDPLLDVLADFLLDAAERLFHLLLELLLDQADALLDVPPDDLLEKPDPLLELFKRLHRHRERDQIYCGFVTIMRNGRRREGQARASGSG